MKKIMLLALGLSLSFNLLSQVSFGPKIGLNSSSGTGLKNLDQYKSSNSKFGIQAGAMINIKFNLFLSLQPEILFTQKSISYSREISGLGGRLTSRIDSAQNFNYLEIPVLLKASLGAKAFKVFINGGPYIGYMLSGKMRYENFANGQQEDKGNFEITEENMNKIDLGVTGGAGFMIGTGEGSFVFEARASKGFTNVYDYSNIQPKHLVLSASVGYLIKLGI